MSQQKVANPQIGFKGQYANMEFPNLGYQEWPKAVYKDGRWVGNAENALHYKELADHHGIDAPAIDPMKAALDENAELRKRLAAYEGDKNHGPVKIASGVVSNTVEMLPPDGSVSGAAPEPRLDTTLGDGQPSKLPHGATAPKPPAGNPLLNKVPEVPAATELLNKVGKN